MPDGAPDLRFTAGSVLIGTYLATAMYGGTIFQMSHYYRTSWRKDTWWLKGYVFYIWMVETVHTYLDCSYIWRSAIAEFGNPLAWSSTTKQDDMVPLITGLIMISVHLFYVRRLWILSNKNIFLCGIVTLLAFAHFFLEITVITLTTRFPSFTQFHKTTPYYTGSLAIAAADDLIIAASLCYFLYTRRTGVRGTDTLVNRIITYSIMTGALTSVVDIANLVCFVTMPNNLVYLGLFDCVPLLYVISFLAMLNAREHLQKISVAGTTNTSGAVSTLAIGAPGQRERRGVDPVSSKLVFGFPSTITTSVTTDTMQESMEERAGSETV